MESVFNLAIGCVRMKISGAEPEEFLNLCARYGVRFWDTEPKDGFTLCLTVPRRQAEKAENLAGRAGCEAVRLFERGLPRASRRLRARWMLALGLLSLAALCVWSSLHIWEIEVTGNETVGDWEILAALDEIGVGIGSYWPAFTSDNIRSEALLLLPELSWLTVNVSGSRAEVIVRERVPVPEIKDEDTPTDIVAEKPGIITELRIYRGEKAVVKGQTVAAGEKLVSGAVSSSFAPLRLERASADIYARTWYTLTAEGSLTETVKTEESASRVYRSLVIGGKRINLYADCGDFGVGTEKTVTEHRLSWKNVFALPLSVINTEVTQYKTEVREVDEDALRSELETLLYTSLLESIGDDGSVVSRSFTAVRSEGRLIVTLRAECTEQIGAERELTESEIQSLHESEKADGDGA